MLDLNSSPLLWEAQIAERHREVAALKDRARVPRHAPLGAYRAG